MVVVKLCGGTGNQFFQYAFGKALKAIGNEVRFDRSYFDTDTSRAYTLDRWNTDVPLSAPRGETITEGTLLYRPEILKKYNQDVTLSGYWQCEKYFKDIVPQIRQDFTLRHWPSEKSQIVANKICNSNSVFLHVRRTDTLAARGLAFHGLVDLDYYSSAIWRVLGDGKDISLFVFSDDIEWCKNNLQYNATYVDHNTSGVVSLPDNEVQRTLDGGTEHEDMWLLSLCKHGITANSSFSWWGGYLIQNPAKIVISPKQWLAGENNELSRDMIPWLRI